MREMRKSGERGVLAITEDRHYTDDGDETIRSNLRAITSIEGPINEENLDVLSLLLHDCDHDLFDTDLFLFHQLFSLRVDYIIPVFRQTMSHSSFTPEKYANMEAFDLLSLEILNETNYTFIAVELLTRALYATESRDFIPESFYRALDKEMPHKSVLLCALLSSCHAIPEHVIKLAISGLVELLDTSDMSGFYRTSVAVLEVCNAGFHIDNSALVFFTEIVTSNAFLPPALCEVILHLLSFMDDPSCYQEWILHIISTTDGPLLNAALTAWMRAFNKWQYEQNAMFAEIIEHRISGFEFQSSVIFFDSIVNPELFYRENIITRCIDIMSDTPARLSCLRFVHASPDKTVFLDAEDCISETIECGDEIQRQLAQEIMIGYAFTEFK